MMEEQTKEHHTCAPAEPTQVPAAAHRRLCCTRLWNLVHGEVENVRPCEDDRGAEKESQTDSPVADSPARVNKHEILDEFVIGLQSYCREEKDLAERMPTFDLRITGKNAVKRGCRRQAG